MNRQLRGSPDSGILVSNLLCGERPWQNSSVQGISQIAADKLRRRITQQEAIHESFTITSDPLRKNISGINVFSGSSDGVALLDMAVIPQKEIDERDKSYFYAGKVVQARYFADVTAPLL